MRSLRAQRGRAGRARPRPAQGESPRHCQRKPPLWRVQAQGYGARSPTYLDVWTVRAVALRTAVLRTSRPKGERSHTPLPAGAGMAPSRLRSLRKLALSHPGPATLHALCPVPTSLSGSSSVSLPSLMPWCMRAAGGCRPHTRFPCSGPPLTLLSIGSYRRRDDSEGAAKSLTRLTFITRTGERISPSMGAPRGCDWQHARTWSSKTSISGSHMRSRVTGRNDSSCKSQ